MSIDYDKVFNEVLKNITSKNNEENKRNAKHILNIFKDVNYDIKDPEEFDFVFNHKLKAALREILEPILKLNNKELKDKYKPMFIYLNYEFLEHNIREFIILREGITSCADKTRFIINMYLNYSIKGEMPIFDASIEKYYISKFGTYEDWINFCDGLYELYFGQPEKYLRFYVKLSACEVRKYKHILYSWKMKLKTGETIEIRKSWDKKPKNILEDENFVKDGFYIVEKHKLKEKDFEDYSKNEVFKRFYFKVPFNEVEEVNLISEEKMV